MSRSTMSSPSSDLIAGPSALLLVSSSASVRIFSASKKNSPEMSSGKIPSNSCGQPQARHSILEHAQLLAHPPLHHPPAPANIVQMLLPIARMAKRQRNPRRLGRAAMNLLPQKVVVRHLPPLRAPGPHPIYLPLTPLE